MVPFSIIFVGEFCVTIYTQLWALSFCTILATNALYCQICTIPHTIKNPGNVKILLKISRIM